MKDHAKAGSKLTILGAAALLACALLAAAAPGASPARAAEVSAYPAWYLAEGSTGGDFETWVLVQNPGTAAVTVDLTFMTSTGRVPGPRDVTIPARSRVSFNAG